MTISRLLLGPDYDNIISKRVSGWSQRNYAMGYSWTRPGKNGNIETGGKIIRSSRFLDHNLGEACIGVTYGMSLSLQNSA